MAPYTYQPTVRDVTSLPMTVDRTLLAALLETSPCQAARESYNGHVSSGEETRATAHPLAREYACPSCDLARALGVPDRFASETPAREVKQGDRVVYIGPLTGDSPVSRWTARRESPGVVLIGENEDGGFLRVWHSRGGSYRAPLSQLRVVERATYTRVYEH